MSTLIPEKIITQIRHDILDSPQYTERVDCKSNQLDIAAIHNVSALTRTKRHLKQRLTFKMIGDSFISSYSSNKSLQNNCLKVVSFVCNSCLITLFLLLFLLFFVLIVIIRLLGGSGRVCLYFLWSTLSVSRYFLKTRTQEYTNKIFHIPIRSQVAKRNNHYQ